MIGALQGPVRALEWTPEGTEWVDDYSRIAAAKGASVVSSTTIPRASERNYRTVRKGTEERALPPLLDLVNSSAGVGWAHHERSSLAERANPDAILALALIHQIAISNNVPLPCIADFFAELSASLLIEFVPKSDAKVRTLLASREDVFPSYTREGRFEIREPIDIPGSVQTLYLIHRRAG